MKPTVSLDMREWTSAARQLKAESSRTCVDFINGQALKVSIEAVRQTDRANRTTIQWLLGALGNEVKFKARTRATKRGQKGSLRTIRGNLMVKPNSFAERILAKRFQLTGEWGVKGNTMEERVRNFIASRTRAAGFIASGWISARNSLFSFVKKKPAGLRAVGEVKRYGRPKGYAKPASFSLSSVMTAEIANTALMANEARPPSTGGNPMNIATRGLQAALNFCARDMLAELARRLDPDFRKVSAR